MSEQQAFQELYSAFHSYVHKAIVINDYVDDMDLYNTLSQSRNRHRSIENQFCKLRDELAKKAVDELLKQPEKTFDMFCKGVFFYIGGELDTFEISHLDRFQSDHYDVPLEHLVYSGPFIAVFPYLQVADVGKLHDFADAVAISDVQYFSQVDGYATILHILRKVFDQLDQFK